MSERTGTLTRVRAVTKVQNGTGTRVPERPLVVAIDGPSGSGKSSTSRGVAERLGLAYLDTGAMYRAATWLAVERGVDLTASEVVAALIAGADIDIRLDPADPSISIEG